MIPSTQAAESVKIPFVESIDRDRPGQGDAFAAALSRRQQPEDARPRQDAPRADAPPPREEPRERADAAAPSPQEEPRDRPQGATDAIAAVEAPVEPRADAPDAEEDAALAADPAAQALQGAAAEVAEVAAAPRGPAQLAPAAQPLDQAHVQAARPALPHLHAPRLTLPEGASLTWSAATAAPPPQETAAVEASALQIWMARALQPGAAANASPVPLPQDPNLTVTQPAQAPLALAGQADLAAAALPQASGDLSKQGEPGQSGHPDQSPLQHSAAAADVQGGPQAHASASPKAQAAARAVSENLRLQSEEGGGTARLEVQVEGERLVIQVRVRGGQVEVDVRGMDANELARLREELEPELARQRLSLGALRQEGAGDGAAERRAPQPEAPQIEEGVTIAPARRPAAPRAAATPRAQEAGLHLEA